MVSSAVPSTEKQNLLPEITSLDTIEDFLCKY